MKIKFSINKYRKNVTSNFNPKLSDYWRDMYYSCFKEW